MRLVSAALLLFACSSDGPVDDSGTTETTTTETTTTTATTTTTTSAVEPMVLAELIDGGLKVEMLAADALFVGWNPVYYRLTDEADGTLVTDAVVTQGPLMTMDSGMQHACPYTNPGTMADANGLFAGELVPTMASGMMGSWTNEVQIHHTAAGTDHTVVFDLDVAETEMKKNLVYGPGEEDFYIVTLTVPEGPLMGLNPFVLTVHEKATMMSFPPVDDLTVSIEPLMPDMGHGSEGNINPTYVAEGRYEGTIDLSMAGYWTVDFTFEQDGLELGVVQYTFNF